MLKKQKENSGLLALGAGQLAEWRGRSRDCDLLSLSAL